MRARWIAVGGGALGLGLALALLRGEPIAGSDQGVYLSIASRMLDGETLYAEVSDPKDPLFFYTYAAALWAGGWRGPFLLDGIWLGLAAISIALLLHELRAPRAAVVASFFIYPLALTSGWFQPGLSMLAGLAVAPLTAWLWLRGQFALSGALLGTLMLFKLPLTGIAAAPLVAFVVLGIPAGVRLRQLARAGLGLAAFMAVAAVVLAARGELRAYLDMTAYNYEYARSGLEHLGPVDRARAHLDVVVQYFERSGRWQLPAAILVLVLFAAAVSLIWMRAPKMRMLAAVALLVLVATFGTLALTAFWDHHLQMLAYPAALLAATLVTVVSTLADSRAAAAGAAVFVAFALWSSVKNESQIEISPAWSVAEPHSGGAVALERARLRFHQGDDDVSYIVFGGNSENGHGAFIGDEFDLACRWFHIYPQALTKYYDETVDCYEREDPELVMVSLGFFDSRRTPREWAVFVSGARRFLDTRYELVETEHPGFEVWARKPVAEVSS